MAKLTLNGKIVDLKRLIPVIFVLVLLVIITLILIKYSEANKELEKARQSLKSQQVNEKVLDFTELFIDKVLKAKTEVDFETRLKLESAVRNLGDEEILTQWQKFTESKTEVQSQEEVKNLLEMLVNKIHPVK